MDAYKNGATPTPTPPDSRDAAPTPSTTLDNSSLDYRFDRLWLVIRPDIWIEQDKTDGEPSDRRSRDDDSSPRTRFFKGRLDHRYNDVADALLTAWTSVIVPAPGATLSLFGLNDRAGIDANFRFVSRTSYARTERAQEVRRAG